MQLPTKVFGVEGRYATALYSAAVKKNILDKTEKEMSAFEDLVAKKPVIAEYLKNPMLKTDQKLATLSELLSSMKFSPTTINLFKTMAENNRLSKIGPVMRSFAQLMTAHRGEVPCTITTVKTLSDSESKSLQKALKGFVKGGQVLKVDTKIDPSIIGGMIVEVGEKYIDLSTKRRIQKFVHLLKEAV